MMQGDAMMNGWHMTCFSSSSSALEIPLDRLWITPTDFDTVVILLPRFLLCLDMTAIHGKSNAVRSSQPDLRQFVELVRWEKRIWPPDHLSHFQGLRLILTQAALRCIGPIWSLVLSQLLLPPRELDEACKILPKHQPMPTSHASSALHCALPSALPCLIVWHVYLWPDIRSR